MTASVDLSGLLARDPICRARDLPGLALLAPPTLLCPVQVLHGLIWLPPGAGAAEVGAGRAVWRRPQTLRGAFPPLPSPTCHYRVVNPGALFCLASRPDGIRGFSSCQVDHNSVCFLGMLQAVGSR